MCVMKALFQSSSFPALPSLPPLLLYMPVATPVVWPSDRRHSYTARKWTLSRHLSLSEAPQPPSRPPGVYTRHSSPSLDATIGAINSIPWSPHVESVAVVRQISTGAMANLPRSSRQIWYALPMTWRTTEPPPAGFLLELLSSLLTLCGSPAGAREWAAIWLESITTMPVT